MNTRLLIISAFVFFAFAPSAFAACPGTCRATPVCPSGEIPDTAFSSLCEGLGVQCCIPNSLGSGAGGSNSCGLNGAGNCQLSCAQITQTEAVAYASQCSGISSGIYVGKCCMPVALPSGGQPSGGAVGNGQPSGGAVAPGGVTLINPLQGGGTLESFLLNILSFIVRIGAIIVVLMMVFVGFKFVAARGDPTKITEARNMLLWTVIGALVLLGAEAIAKGIEATVQALGG